MKGTLVRKGEKGKIGEKERSAHLPAMMLGVENFVGRREEELEKISEGK